MHGANVQVVGKAAASAAGGGLCTADRLQALADFGDSELAMAGVHENYHSARYLDTVSPKNLSSTLALPTNSGCQCSTPAFPTHPRLLPDSNPTRTKEPVWSTTKSS